MPGYVLAIVAVADLRRPAPAARRGPRVAVELALFITACLVVVELLLLGPDGALGGARTSAERLVLGAAVRRHVGDAWRPR